MPLKCPVNDDYVYQLMMFWTLRVFLTLLHSVISFISNCPDDQSGGGRRRCRRGGREVKLLPRWLLNYLCAPLVCPLPLLLPCHSSLPEQLHVTLWCGGSHGDRPPGHLCLFPSLCHPHPACYRFLFEGVGE